SLQTARGPPLPRRAIGRCLLVLHRGYLGPSLHRRLSGAEDQVRSANPSTRSLTRPEWRLWFSLLGPPFAWGAAQQASFLLTPWVCATGRRWALYLVTAAACLAAIAGVVTAWRTWKASPGENRESDSTQMQRRFIAGGGLLLGIF